MSLDQVTITWSLMLLQGLRRLYECMYFTKPSSAQMWVGHWAFGVWFYISVNIAVWVEGIRKFKVILLPRENLAENIPHSHTAQRVARSASPYFQASLSHYLR